MKIGIDIDDTLTNNSAKYFEYFENHDNKDYFINNALDILTGKLNSEYISKELFNLHRDETARLELADYAFEVVNRLAKKFEIIIVTKRGFRGSNTEFDLEEITRNYLKEKRIPYSKIYFKVKDKKEIIEKEKIDFMIDDSVSLINSLGSKGILITSLANEGLECNNRFNSWLEIEDYLNTILERRNV